MPSLWDYIIPKQQPPAPPRLNESPAEAAVRGFGEGAESGARGALDTVSSFIPGYDYLTGVAEQGVKGLTDKWNVASEIGGELADIGKVAGRGLSLAAGWIPVSMRKGLAEALARRVDANPYFPGQTYTLDLIDQYPNTAAHASNVRPMNWLDKATQRNPNLYDTHSAQHLTAVSQNPVHRQAMKNSPTRRKFLEEIIETPKYKDLSLSTQGYWDDYDNFDQIVVSPKFEEHSLRHEDPFQYIRKTMGEEFGHLGQSAMNRFDDNWLNLPYSIRPEEVGAKVTAKMIGNRGMNYNAEVLDHLNKAIKEEAIFPQEINTALRVFNERLRHTGKQIVPVRNSLGGITGVEMLPIGGEEIKSPVTMLKATLRGVKP